MDIALKLLSSKDGCPSSSSLGSKSSGSTSGFERLGRGGGNGSVIEFSVDFVSAALLGSIIHRLLLSTYPFKAGVKSTPGCSCNIVSARIACSDRGRTHLVKQLLHVFELRLKLFDATISL